MRVDQYLPDFAPHDAIGNHVLATRHALREAGIESEIWAEVIHPPLVRQARPMVEHPGEVGGGAMLYHASTHGDMAAVLRRRAAEGDPLLVYYHNITPALYFARWLPEAARSCEQGRAELAELASATGLALAASAYNEAELVELGYPATAVSPLLIDLERCHVAADVHYLARLRRRREHRGARWLFVGRIAPNKCQHDVIGAFSVYCQAFDPTSQLALVGSSSSARYLRALQEMVAHLGLEDNVEFTGSLAPGELAAEYATADVFVCCSEHEGFCVPLIEAMELSVPVVAYAAAAVPETVGDAGVLLDDKDPLTVAVAVDSVLADPARRERLLEAGRTRAAAFSLPVTSKSLIGHVSAYLERV